MSFVYLSVGTTVHLGSEAGDLIRQTQDQGRRPVYEAQVQYRIEPSKTTSTCPWSPRTASKSAVPEASRNRPVPPVNS
jgi:hypothetical protein